ncbi:metallophosphoesterase [Thermophagus sp. OGC60D27]|uniref:metallophosphoesterase n=1 Tax=Thermophagus sp. OGC60D27 TaxID=3458415 RepID=UPI004038200D
MIFKIINKVKTTPVAPLNRPEKVLYDIIGDVHGHARELQLLLKQMDYRKINDVWFHPERKAVFVGDFTCRGPQTRETINIIRLMVENDSGLAILGNHEMNVIGHFTKNGDNQSFKPATGSNKRLMDNIRAEYIYEREQLKADLKWLRRLPFAIDLGPIRIVHAYWNPSHLERIEQRRTKRKLTKKLLLEIFSPDTELGKAVRQTTRGIEINLPHDLIIKDQKNIRRTSFRVKWWEPPYGKTFRQMGFGNKFILPEYTVPPEIIIPFDVYPPDAPPVFVGHYCVPPSHMMPADNVCCVDNCLANGGQLAAYRWNGEPHLKMTNFVFQRKRTLE